MKGGGDRDSDSTINLLAAYQVGRWKAITGGEVGREEHIYWGK